MMAFSITGGSGVIGCAKTGFLNLRPIDENKKGCIATALYYDKLFTQDP
jgi:hypothetical protein